MRRETTRKIVIAAMLAAVYVVIDYFSIQITPALRISLTMLPVAMAGAILGWQYGAMVGAVGDVLMYFLKNNSGAYIPGLTIGMAATGAVFGLILHRYLTGAPKQAPTTGFQIVGGASPSPTKNGRTRFAPTVGLLVRVIIAQVIVTVFISLLWNTWNLAMAFRNTFEHFFWVRVWGSLAEMGVLVVVEYVVLVAFRKTTNN